MLLAANFLMVYKRVHYRLKVLKVLEKLGFNKASI